MRVDIKDKENVIRFSMQSADPSAWIAQGTAENWWGLPERWINLADATEEEIAEAIDTRQIEVDGQLVDQILLPADYTIEQTDITTQYDTQVALNNRAANYPSYAAFLAAWASDDAEQIQDIKDLVEEVNTEYPLP